MDTTPPAAELSANSTEYRRQLLILLLIALAARLLFLAAKPTAVSSIDAFVWEDAGRAQYLGKNPYLTRLFNWLPPLSWLALGMYWFSLKSGIAFVSLLWTFLISVEMGLLAATYRLIGRFASPIAARNALLVGVALNPAAILQTAQHASFHVVLMLYVMLAIDRMVLFHRTREPTHWRQACGWLGLGVLTKTVPLGLFPLLISNARRLPARTLFAGAALLAGPMLIGLAVVFPSAPKVIWQSVVLYHALGGYFGVSGLLAMISGDINTPWIEHYASIFAPVLAAMLGWLSIKLWLRPFRDARLVVLAAATIFLLVLTLGPGFGSQYVYWLLPTYSAVWALFDDQALRRGILQTWLVTAITYTIIYCFLPSHGALVLHLLPRSAISYRIELYLIEPTHETIARLPMFLSCLSLAIQSLRVLRRGCGADDQIAFSAGPVAKLA